jgi:hypothetical protein
VSEKWGIGQLFRWSSLQEDGIGQTCSAFFGPVRWNRIAIP